jgi:gluconolactonase
MRLRELASAVALVLAAAAVARAAPPGSAAASPTPPEETSVERLDPRLDALLPAGAALERVADGYAWTEGPLWDRRDGSLLFSDVPRNAVFRWTEGLGARLPPSLGGSPARTAWPSTARAASSSASTGIAASPGASPTAA